MLRLKGGSPPRMRGKELAVGVIRQHGGITPAHAGKRACTTTGTTRRKDHPRVCGEKSASTSCCALALGSPPRMRGKAVSRPFTGLTRMDHPRTCGEKGWDYDAFLYQLGSPPHVRGKEKQRRAEKSALRITPACAGKRLFPGVKTRCFQDHPRMCGEKARQCLRGT